MDNQEDSYDDELRIRTLSILKILGSQIESSYDDITKIASTLTDTPISMISFLDQNKEWVKSSHGTKIKEIPKEDSISFSVIPKNEFSMISDLSKDPELKKKSFVNDKKTVLFYAGIPLTIDGRCPLGMLSVLDYEAKTLSEVQVKQLIALGRLAESLLSLRLKDIQIDEKNQLLRRATKELQKLETTDSLTQLYNHRVFFDRLEIEIKSAYRIQQPLSLIFVDIDFFKHYNDLYGHMMGDQCLLKIAEVLNQSANRPRDFLARYGGEEFVCLLPETDIKGAINIANNIIGKVNGLEMEHKQSKAAKHVTVSLGVVSLDLRENDISAKELCHRADQALYYAKNSGRNRYSIYEYPIDLQDPLMF